MMRRKMKLLIYFGSVAAFIFYLVFANFLFNNVLKIKGESRVVNFDLPKKTGGFRFSLDEIKIVKLKWKDVVYIRGWVINPNSEIKRKRMYLVLKDQQSVQVWEPSNDNLIRTDVSRVFHLDETNSNHGFEFKMPLSALKGTTFRIGFVIEDVTGKWYYLTNKTVELINDKTAAVVKTLPSKIKENSDRVSMEIRSSRRTGQYNVDFLESGDEFLDIRGWAFLDGCNTKSFKSYIILRGNNRDFLFDHKVICRKDVTSHFSASGLDLDSSGFAARIPLNDLGNGEYKIGLYLVKGEYTAVLFSPRTIIVNK